MTRTRRLQKNFESAMFGVDWDISVGMQALEINNVPAAVEALGSAKLNLREVEYCARKLIQVTAISRPQEVATS